MRCDECKWWRKDPVYDKENEVHEDNVYVGTCYVEPKRSSRLSDEPGCARYEPESKCTTYWADQISTTAVSR